MSRFYLLSIVILLCGLGCARIPVAEVGDRAPNFALPTVNSKSSLDLHASQARLIVLNFWSTTCISCLKELPELNRLHTDGAALVIGIALDKDSERVEKVVTDNKIAFEVVMGTQELFEQYDGYSIPYTLVLDHDKKIRKRFRGVASHDAIVKVIEQIENLDGSVAYR